MVFFEAPHRTEAALAAMAEAWGDERSAAVCRELTKTHEEVRRGPLAELAAWAADGVRGEVTIVVAGATPGAGVPTDDESLRAAVAEREATGMSRKEAIVEVARTAGRAQAARLRPGARATMTRLLRYRHDGLTFDVRDEGPLDGDPVVLLHGFPERATCWRDVAPLLHAAGAAHLRARPARLLARRPAAAAPRLHDGQARGRRRRADRDHRRPGAPGRPRLGRQLRLAGRGAPPRAGADLDRGLGAAPGGVPQGDLLAAARSFSSWYMGAFQTPRLPERLAATARRPVRPGAAQRRHDPGGRRPVPPRDRGRTARSPAG